MKKLLIISQVFWQKHTWNRWELLTDLYPDIDITLLAPKIWTDLDGKNYTFGNAIIGRGEAYEKERFRVRLIDMRKIYYFDWLSFNIFNEIRKCQPDLVYYIGHEMQDPLIETIFASKLFAPNAKIAAFSMRGRSYKINYGKSWKQAIIKNHNKLKWNIIKKYCDALFCHYPDARRTFREDSYTRPIYIQTQIGVNSSVFIRNEIARRSIRDKYKLGDNFVFGSATRFTADKGVFEVIKALPSRGNWRYLMLGAGNKDEEDAIRSEIVKLGLHDKVITPGFINPTEMPDYLSAMDCAIHVPRTTPQWVETFSLALVQAMSSGLPVIGNTSGSVPYQLGKEGIIVPEGDIDELRAKMIHLIDNPDEARSIGLKMRERVIRCFDITHLAHCFHSTMIDIIAGSYNPNKVDMAEFSPRDWENKVN